MSLQEFLAIIPKLNELAAEMLIAGSSGGPEANTKDKLIEPLLDSLGFDAGHRHLEGEIRSLCRASSCNAECYASCDMKSTVW